MTEQTCDRCAKPMAETASLVRRMAASAAPFRVFGRAGEGGWEVKLTTEQNDDLAVRKGKDKEGRFVELLTEDSQYILTPKEAERLGNALIKAALPKQKREENHVR